MNGPDFFTPAERAAMDRATVPAPAANFAASVVAAALAGKPAAPRGRSRRGWRHHRRVLIGAGALFLTSATAAATGLLDHLPSPLPALASVFHSAPAPKPAPTPRATAKPIRHAAPAPAAVAAPLDPRLAERAARIERGRERIAEFRARRIAEGRPVLRPEARAVIARRIRARVQAMPPEQRKVLRERVLARQRSLDAPLAEPMANRPGLESPAAPGARRRLERRRLWRERLNERRAARFQER